MLRKKVAFICTVYRSEELAEVERLRKEIKNLNFKNYQLYISDNREDNRGYAYGINQGIRKALRDGCKIFVIMNSDISVKALNKQAIGLGLEHFDILGFAMKQNGKTYYGGEIDKNRLSGGLVSKKPNKQYRAVDFVSGSLMIIKKAVLDKIGLLNEKYFLYYEDVEYCLLAARQDFRVGIDSRNLYEHYEVSRVDNSAKDRWLFVNRFRFFLRFSNAKQKLRELLRIPLTTYEHLPLLFAAVKRSPFAVNFFSLNFSSILAKFTHFFIFIVLIRSLSPAQYGIYAIVWAFVNLFTPFLDFGTTTYGLVYSETKEKKSKLLFSLRLYLSVLVYLVILISSWFFFKSDSTKIFIALTATSIFSSSLAGSYLIYNSLREKVAISSVLNIAFNVVFAIIVILALLLKQGIQYLFISYALCYLGYALVNTLLLKRFLSVKSYPKQWMAILKQSLVFVLISFLANFYFKTDIFMLKRFYNNEVVGIYSAGLKFLDALLIIPGSYNVIVIPIMKRLANRKYNLISKVKKDLVFLFILGAFVTFGFYFLAPLALPWFFKAKFNASLEAARILAFSIWPILLTSVFYNALYGLRKERLVLGILILQTIVTVFSYWLVIPQFGLNGAMYTKLGLEIFNTVLTFIIFKFALN